MKRPDKPVIVEVKRGGRKTLVKAVKPKTRTVLHEPPKERPQNEAWRAADRLFSAKTGADAPADDKHAPARRVLRSLEEPHAAAATEAEPVRKAKPARAPQSPEPGRRRGRPPKVAAAELRRPAPDEAEVARALETLGRLEAHRRAAGTAGRSVGPDLVERRRSSAEPLVPTQKRRGRPPKPRPETREVALAERIWTSSKILLEDDSSDSAPVRPAMPAVPTRVLAHNVEAAPEPRERASFRSRLGLSKPGERWKRRLRGYAR